MQFGRFCFGNFSFTELAHSPNFALDCIVMWSNLVGQYGQYSLTKIFLSKLRKQYQSARRHLERAQQYTGTRFVFPMNESMILVLVAYLFEVRNLKGKTVSKILSALRTLHLVEGCPEPSLRPAVVKMVLRGW